MSAITQPGSAYGGSPDKGVLEGAPVGCQRVPGAWRQGVVVAQDALREDPARGHRRGLAWWAR